MHNLHHQLMRRNGLYARWHQHPITNILHFVVFVMVAILLSLLIIQNQTNFNFTLSLKRLGLANTTTGISSQTINNPINVNQLTSSTINFSWPAITGATGYKIYLAPEPTSLNISTDRKLLTTLPATTLNYRITNLAANVDLFIHVEGVGTTQYYDLYAKTLGGQQAELDNFITNGEAGTAIQSVSLYAPDILLLVIRDKKLQTYATPTGSLVNNTGPDWQTTTGWSITRNNNTPLTVTNAYRDSIPVGHFYDEVKDGGNTYGGAQRSEYLDVEHNIYLKLNTNIGQQEVLTVTGPRNLNITIPVSDKYLETPVIQVNQVGYNPEATKRYAYISGWMGTGGALSLNNFPTKANILTENSAPLTPRTAVNSDLDINLRSVVDPASGTAVKEINLASVTASDSTFYRVQIPGVGVSYRTMVSNLGTLKAYYVTTRGLFLNRWGRILDCDYTDWCTTPARPADHITVYKNDTPQESSTFFSSTTPKTNGTISLTGGHHDAGDFDIKEQHYIVARQLMRSYELNPSTFRDNQLNIPESGNGIPDFLDEALYSIKAWEQLQDADGGVRTGAESWRHPFGAYFADADPLPYWTHPKNAIHSLRVAGLFAQASRLVAPFNATKASELRTAAINAYDYALDQNIQENIAGPMLYANSELYLLTNDQKYKTKFETTWQTNSIGGAPAIRNLEYWATAFRRTIDQPVLSDFILGYFKSPNANQTYKNTFNNRLNTDINTEITAIENNYAHRNGLPITWSPGWGKSVAQGEYLMAIYSKLQLGTATNQEKQEYINEMSLLSDYVLGANPLGMSWVTGLGSRSPQNPLHSDSITFQIVHDMPPIPGIPVYGPGPLTSAQPYYNFGRNVMYPSLIDRPTMRKYGDIRSFVDANEFTVWETQSNVTSLFATLLGQSNSSVNIPTSWQPGRADHQDRLPLDETVRPVSLTGSTGEPIPTPPPENPPVSEIEMISVPTSSFPMGTSTAILIGNNETPRHNISLSAYDIGKFEVTNNQYIEFLNDSKSSLKKSNGEIWNGDRNADIYGGNNPKLLLGFRLAEVSITYNPTTGHFIPKTRQTKFGGTENMGNYPTTDVTWYGAVMYTNWLSQKEGLQPVYNTTTWTADLSKNGYRLPTEAEWERAAAWDGTKHWIYAFSADTLSGKARANYYDGPYVNPAGGNDLTNTHYTNPKGLVQDALTPYTSPVGWFNGINVSPNSDINNRSDDPGLPTINSVSPVGAYDMTGNVFEWTNDWYLPTYYQVSPTSDPAGPSTGEIKVIRGGAWGRVVGALNNRTTMRKPYPPTTADGMIGFRLAKNAGDRSTPPTSPLPPSPTPAPSPDPSRPTIPTPIPPTSPTPSDTTPPTVSIASPRPGQIVSGLVNVLVDAGDNSGTVAKVELYIGSRLSRTDFSKPFSFTVDARTVKNGPYTISAKAYDSAGNVTTSVPVTATVSNLLNTSNIFEALNNLFKRLFNWWR